MQKPSSAMIVRAGMRVRIIGFPRISSLRRTRNKIPNIQNRQTQLICDLAMPALRPLSAVIRTFADIARMTEFDPLRERRLMTRLPDPVGLRVSGSREPNGPAAELDAVNHRAPALAGQDWKGARQGAGGDDVAGCKRRMDRIAREQADEMAQRRERAVEHIGAMAAIDHGAIAQQIDLETCEIGSPIGGAAEAGRMAWREQQSAVQAIDDDGVGGRELPARKNRVNDLEALCHPVDAAEQRRLVHLGGGRGGKAEHDLGLDARLGERRQRKRVLCSLTWRRE